MRENGSYRLREMRFDDQSFFLLYRAPEILFCIRQTSSTPAMHHCRIESSYAHEFMAESCRNDEPKSSHARDLSVGLITHFSYPHNAFRGEIFLCSRLQFATHAPFFSRCTGCVQGILPALCEEMEEDEIPGRILSLWDKSVV